MQRVYDATRDGLDIITDLLSGIDDGVINQKEAFRLRPEERTPQYYEKRPCSEMVSEAVRIYLHSIAEK